MSLFSKVNDLLRDTKIPVVMEPYNGFTDTYLSIENVTESETDYGDDLGNAGIVHFDLILYCPAVWNYETTKYKIRHLMRQSDRFTAGSISYGYDPELQVRSIIMHYQYEEG